MQLQESGVCNHFIVKCSNDTLDYKNRSSRLFNGCQVVAVVHGGYSSRAAAGGGGAGGYRASGYGPSPLQGSNQELKLGIHMQ